MKNYFDIKDKVAVVTGASSGLGWQIAQAYASQGAKLALFARREERLIENKKELEQFKQLKDMKIVMPKWLEFNAEKLTGKINALPQRDDIDLNIREHLIIELYSK